MNVTNIQQFNLTFQNFVTTQTTLINKLIFANMSGLLYISDVDYTTLRFNELYYSSAVGYYDNIYYDIRPTTKL